MTGHSAEAPSPPAPTVQDAGADRRFRERARNHGWDPDDKFVGGYVDWEWDRSRHVFDGLFTSVQGKRALEFGCHFGGTAIVLAALGAEVTALDVDAQYVELTRLNSERYGLADRIRTLHVPDTTALPFEAGEFTLVSCNSVLEYVPRDALATVQREIDRVLAPGGHVVILGTSNRLWPYDMHGRQWLMNYVPRSLRHLFSDKPSESVTPWRLKAGFPGYPDLLQADDGRLIVELRARMGTAAPRLKLLAAANRLLARLDMHIGYVSPHINMVLQKHRG